MCRWLAGGGRGGGEIVREDGVEGEMGGGVRRAPARGDETAHPCGRFHHYIGRPQKSGPQGHSDHPPPHCPWRPSIDSRTPSDEVLGGVHQYIRWSPRAGPPGHPPQGAVHQENRLSPRMGPPGHPPQDGPKRAIVDWAQQNRMTAHTGPSGHPL